MANLNETATWEVGVYQWETSDPVQGGPNGIDNKPTRQLANRTLWLKNEIAKAVQSIGQNKNEAAQLYALKTTSLTAGAGLTGGGVFRDNMTLALGTPGTCSGSTTNWAGSDTHTHQLAAASPTVAGVAKLINNLTTDDANSALSAAMGKKLAEQSVVYQSWATEQIAGKANKSSTRAGYGITDASEVAVLTGQLNHGGTIPLPPGYREDQCKWLVSMAEDDPNYTSWDISEGGLSKHYYYRCYTRGRTVIAKVYHGSSDQNPDSNSQGWVLGKVNYICIGVK